MRALTILAAAALLATDLALAQQPPPNRPLRPRRDRPAENRAAGTARLAGRVIAADSGRPLKRARITVHGSNPANPDEAVRRIVVTDENGRFAVPDLPAGKYSVSAAKTGYVTMAAGQRRPLRPGVQLELADGQAIANVDLRLPRGGVIAGRVRDEDGEPLARATVRVLRFQYAPGGRHLVPAESDQTDDRGEYRVFGLPPGEYVVSAAAGPLERVLRTGGGETLLARSEETLNYAPTYYPGVISLAEAARVAVSAGQEQQGIDFSLLMVPTARVQGVLVGQAAEAAERATVMLISEEAASARRASSYRTRVAADSTFTLEMVPPGRYLAIAMAGPPASRLYAVQSVTVSGEDIDGLALTLAPGATVSGTIRFEGASGSMAAEMTSIGIRLEPIDPLFFGGGGTGSTRKEAGGTFRAAGVPPGRQVLRVSPPRGWTVRSATLDGRDITEEVLDVKAGQTITGVEIVLSDRGAQIAGAVKAESDATGSTVIIFPADQGRWGLQSARIRTAQVDRDGRYAIDGLPAGDYLIAAIEDVEPGEWFDLTFLHTVSEGAVRVALDEGTRATKDLRLTRVP